MMPRIAAERIPCGNHADPLPNLPPSGWFLAQLHVGLGWAAPAVRPSESGFGSFEIALDERLVDDYLTKSCLS